MADQKLTEYTTMQGDRWDTVAFKATGDPTKIFDIIEANPDVPVTDIIEPPGSKLSIPVVESAQLNSNLLPPWKR